MNRKDVEKKLIQGIKLFRKTNDKNVDEIISRVPLLKDDILNKWIKQTNFMCNILYKAKMLQYNGIDIRIKIIQGDIYFNIRYIDHDIVLDNSVNLLIDWDSVKNKNEDAVIDARKANVKLECEVHNIGTSYLLPNNFLDLYKKDENVLIDSLESAIKEINMVGIDSVGTHIARSNIDILILDMMSHLFQLGQLENSLNTMRYLVKKKDALHREIKENKRSFYASIKDTYEYLKKVVLVVNNLENIRN